MLARPAPTFQRQNGLWSEHVFAFANSRCSRDQIIPFLIQIYSPSAISRNIALDHSSRPFYLAEYEDKYLYTWLHRKFHVPEVQVLLLRFSQRFFLVEYHVKIYPRACFLSLHFLPVRKIYIRAMSSVRPVAHMLVGILLFSWSFLWQIPSGVCRHMQKVGRTQRLYNALTTPSGALSNVRYFFRFV